MNGFSKSISFRATSFYKIFVLFYEFFSLLKYLFYLPGGQPPDLKIRGILLQNTGEKRLINTLNDLPKYVVSRILSCLLLALSLFLPGGVHAHSYGENLVANNGDTAEDVYVINCPNSTTTRFVFSANTTSGPSVMATIVAPDGRVATAQESSTTILGTGVGNYILIMKKNPAIAGASVFGYSLFCTMTNGLTDSLSPMRYQNDRLPDSTLTTTTTLVGKIDITPTPATHVGSIYKRHIYRSESPNGPFTKIGSVSSNAVFSDTSVTPGIQYWYKATTTLNPSSFNNAPINQDIQPRTVASGIQTVIPAIAGVAVAPATAMPSGLSASTTAIDQVNLTWSSVSGASYKVYRATSSTGPFTTSIASPTATSFADTTSVNGTSYWYTVSAVISGNEGAQSAAVTGKSVALPATPTGLTASTSTLDQVNLTWSSVSGASYKVYRATSSTGPFTTSIASPTATSFADTTSVNGTSYWYTVSAITNGNEGAQSGAVTGQSVALPVAPTGLTASTTSLDQVDLAWDVITDASYKVYRGTSPTGPFSLLTSPTGTSFADTTSVNGTPYWYTVSAVTNGNEGAQSGAVTGESIGLPATPAGLTASNNQVDKIDLSWTAVAGAQYLIYRADTSTGPFNVLGSVTTENYSDTSITSGIAYWYTVSAIAYGNEGAQSTPASGQALAMPVIPSGLTATQGTVIERVSLTWDAVNAVTGYGVYRDGAQVGITSDLFYDDVLVGDILVHNYTISALASGLESAQSEWVSGFAKAQSTGGVADGTPPPTTSHYKIVVKTPLK